MNKKGIMIGVASLGAVVGLIKLLNTKSEPEKYTRPWMEKLTDAALDAEREKVRLGYCHAGTDSAVVSWYENTLRLFDDVIRERKYSNTPSKPHAYSIPREHGWNLYKPD